MLKTNYMECFAGESKVYRGEGTVEDMLCTCMS